MKIISGQWNKKVRNLSYGSINNNNEEVNRKVERILKITKKSGNRERDVGCCLYETVIEAQALAKSLFLCSY